AAAPSCNPWSMVAATTRRSRACASKTVPASSARESAPPEQATTTAVPAGSAVARSGSSSTCRTPARTAARAGSSATVRSAVDPAHPRARVGDLVLRWQVGGVGPHGVEPVVPDPVDHAGDEGGAVAVLRHLLVEAEQAAQHPVEHTHALAAPVELAADLLQRADHLRAGLVHDHIGVALEQRHQAGDALDDGALLRAGEEVDQADVACASQQGAGALEDGAEELRRTEVDC